MTDLPTIAAAISTAATGLVGSAYFYTYAETFYTNYGPRTKKIADYRLAQFYQKLRSKQSELMGREESPDTVAVIWDLAKIGADSESLRAQAKEGVSRLRWTALMSGAAGVFLAAGIILVAIGGLIPFILTIVFFAAFSVALAFAGFQLLRYNSLVSFIHSKTLDLNLPVLSAENQLSIESKPKT